MPHKRNIVSDLDHLTPAARACDAVNTVWRDGDAWWGDNTDARGFIDAVVAHRHPDFTRPAAVLGVGGAGRAVASGLASAGVAVIHLLNRTRDSAETAAAHLAQHHPDTRFVVHSLTQAGFNAVADSLGVVATCVSGPGLDAIHALSVAPLSPRVVWVDLNYWCDEVPHAEALGDRLLSGIPMLAHQAAHAFARWTGVHPDPNDLPMGT